MHIAVAAVNRIIQKEAILFLTRLANAVHILKSYFMLTAIVRRGIWPTGQWQCQSLHRHRSVGGLMSDHDKSDILVDRPCAVRRLVLHGQGQFSPGIMATQTPSSTTYPTPIGLLRNHRPSPRLRIPPAMALTQSNPGKHHDDRLACRRREPSKGHMGSH
jgi:hypothetical protein